METAQLVTNPWHGLHSQCDSLQCVASSGSGLVAYGNALAKNVCTSLWKPTTTTKNLRTRLHSNLSFCGKTSVFDEAMLLSIGKYLQGHLRREEFHTGSYRKIHRHLSLGSSVTMTSGGGPRSRQLSSVSCVLVLRLNTLSCSTCFGSPPIILQIILFIHRDQLLSRHLPEPLLPCFPPS